jgi:hypothetical protein
VRRSVYCTASFSVCSLRRTELPIIYADFRLDYKLATLPLQDLCTTQVAQDEEVKRIEISDALQDVLVMQPAVMVGLISMMTGSALQEDIAATTRVLLSKGQDILARRLWSQNNPFSR